MKQISCNSNNIVYYPNRSTSKNNRINVSLENKYKIIKIIPFLLYICKAGPLLPFNKLKMYYTVGR